MRLLSLFFVLFSVISLTFLLMRLSPGGPFDAEKKLPPAIEHQLLLKYRLDGSLWQQYTDYLCDLVHGDLRLSTKYRNQSVAEILARTLPVTFSLGGISLVLSLLLGILGGIMASLKPHSFLDRCTLHLTLLAVSLPTFVLGPLFILCFCIWLHWFPVGGWGSFSQLFLPAMTLSLPFAAIIARLLRDQLREVFQNDFMRTAQAKGLSQYSLISHHALRVAILPVISYTGPLAANLLTGSIVVETLFHIPGTGSFFVNAILNRDSFLLGGIVIVYCTLLLCCNFCVDLAYRYLDPRIK